MPMMTRDGEEILGWKNWGTVRGWGAVRSEFLGWGVEVRGHHWTTTYGSDGWWWEEQNAEEFQTLCDLPECTCRREGVQTAQGGIL
jgi:hypothetical protein